MIGLDVTFSPAWDTIVKLTLPRGWLHLSFRGHRPYRFRRNDGSCSELAPRLMFDDFLPIMIPDGESLPFYPLVLNLVVCVAWQWPTGRGGTRAVPVRLRFRVTSGC